MTVIATYTEASLDMCHSKHSHMLKWLRHLCGTWPLYG